MGIDTEPRKRKLAHVDAADGNHARGFQMRNHIGIVEGRRSMGKNLGARRRRQTGDVEQVLPGNRNAIEKAK